MPEGAIKTVFLAVAILALVGVITGLAAVIGSVVIATMPFLKILSVVVLGLIAAFVTCMMIVIFRIPGWR